MRISALTNRPMMYLFSDGVDELLLGIFLILYATAAMIFPRMGFAAPLLLILCAFGMKWSAGFLRRRIIAPRGGHVVVSVRPWLRVLAGCVAALFVLALKLTASAHFSIATVSCTMFLAAWLIAGAIYRLPYMFVLAALAGALGFWVNRRNSDVTFVMQCLGLMSSVAGAVKLWRFIRSHPVASEGEA